MGGAAAIVVRKVGGTRVGVPVTPPRGAGPVEEPWVAWARQVWFLAGVPAHLLPGKGNGGGLTIKIPR